MIAHRVYVYTSTLGTIRAPERKSVSLHRASRHVVTDITRSKKLLPCYYGREMQGHYSLVR
jgi:hypothetical protein